MNSSRLDFLSVNRVALSRFPALLIEWFPEGRIQGKEFLARNPRRDDRHLGSFTINLRSGRWCDFASGDRGGDPVSLYAFLHGIGQAEAAIKLAQELGVSHGL